MLCVVAPVFQRYELPAVDVRVTFGPVHIVVGPFAVSVGAGRELALITVGSDDGVHPFPEGMATV